MESSQHIAWHVKVFAVATFLPEYLRLSILLLPQVPPALTHSMKSLVNISKSSSDVCFRKDTLGWQAGRTGAAWGEENELGKSLHQPTRGISAYSQSFRLIWAMSFLWWYQWKTHPWQTGRWLSTGKFQITTGTVSGTAELLQQDRWRT